VIGDNWNNNERAVGRSRNNLKCEDCGKTNQQALAGDYPQPLDKCPDCGKVVCNVCSEREVSFCCVAAGDEANDALKALTY
jgi:hypothetical protein